MIFAEIPLTSGRVESEGQAYPSRFLGKGSIIIDEHTGEISEDGHLIYVQGFFSAYDVGTSNGVNNVKDRNSDGLLAIHI